LKLAAIDIGSNAIRLLIEEARLNNSELYFKKISLTRVPVRLGSDVFKEGFVSVKKTNQLLKSIVAFSHLIELNEVEHFRIVATSAMREASNGEEIIRLIKQETGLTIEIISGELEADLIFANFFLQNYTDPSQRYIFIDVGGGSTELSFIEKNERKASKSFQIGALRSAEVTQDGSDVWAEIELWIKELHLINQSIISIGTGGNINRIFKESKHRFLEKISYSEIEQVASYIGSFSLEDRIRKLRLKPDRADVIIPSSEIYLKVMRLAGSQKMIVPKVGLSDGVIYDLYQKKLIQKGDLDSLR
jgi:exopolyphosphatase/guanosine-5'-triphosphate,3'-diphosphate pyrophosphatase